MGVFDCRWNQPVDLERVRDWRLVLQDDIPSRKSMQRRDSFTPMFHDLEQADALLRLRTLKSGLAYWRSHASRHRLSRFALDAYQRRRGRAASRALNRWWLFCERQKQKVYVGNAKSLLVHKVRYFKRWHRHAMSLKSRRTQCELLSDVRRSHLRSASRILRAWRAQVQRSVGYRHNLRRALQAEVSCAADAFFIWFSGICQQQELRRQNEVAVCIHVRHSRKKWAMNRLRRRQDVGKRLSHHDRVATKIVLQNWQEVTRRWRPLRLRLAWLTNAVLRRMMLRAWRKVSGVEQQLRLLLNYCDHRCTRSLLFRVFHHWRALRDTKLGCMASLIYKEELNATSLVSRAWRAWMLVLQRHASLAAAALKVMGQARRRLLYRWYGGLHQHKKLVKLLHQHMTRCISLALLGWSLLTAHKLLLRKRSEEQLSRRQLRRAAGSLLHWAAWARRTRGNQLALEWMTKGTFRSVSRRVFNAWTDATFEAGVHRRAAKSFLRRLLFRSWRSWCLACTKQQALRIAAAEVQRKRTGRVLLPWRRLTSSVRHCWGQSRAAHRAALSMALQDHEQLTSRMTTHYRHHLLIELLHAWYDETSSSKSSSSLNTRKRALGDAVRLSLRRRYWSTWRRVHAWRAIDAGMLRRAGIAQRGPWHMWTAWRRFAEARRRCIEHGAKVRVQQQRWRFQRHLSRWRLAAWSSWCFERRQSRQIRGCLLGWKEVMKESKQLEGMLAHRAVLEQGRLLHASLQQWHREVQDQVIARAIRQKRRFLWASSLLLVWREECQRLRLLRAESEELARSFRQRQDESRDSGLRLLGSYLAAWRKCTHMMRQHKKAAKSLEKTSTRTTVLLQQNAFLCWVSWMRRRLEHYSEQQAVLAQREARLLKCCLRSWSQTAKVRKSRAKDLRSERAIVAWRLLLLDLREYGAA